MTASRRAASGGTPRLAWTVVLWGRDIGSGDVVTATLVDGHSSGVPEGWAEAAPVGRGHEHPPGKK